MAILNANSAKKFAKFAPFAPFALKKLVLEDSEKLGIEHHLPANHNPWKMNNRLVTLLFLFLLAACQPEAGSPVPPTPDGTNPASQTEQPTLVPVSTDIPLPSVYAAIRIAYTAQEQIWLWENGETIPLTSANTDTPLAFSTSGDQIAFIRDGELLTIHIIGTDERTLISAQEMAAIAPQNPAGLVQFSWVPGKSLLLVSTLNDSGIGLQTIHDLYLLDADTGEIVSLFASGQGGIT